MSKPVSSEVADEVMALLRAGDSHATRNTSVGCHLRHAPDSLRSGRLLHNDDKLRVNDSPGRFNPWCERNAEGSGQRLKQRGADQIVVILYRRTRSVAVSDSAHELRASISARESRNHDVDHLHEI